MNVARHAAGALALAVLAGAGCQERRPLPPLGSERERVGVYKGVADSGTGKARRFRVQLWAAPPDRLHAEMAPPIGGPTVILDAGNGRLSVTLPRERAAYVGAASAGAIGAATGVSVSLDDLVRWILVGSGGTSAGATVRRVPEQGPGLPRELEIRAGERMLRIELRETLTVDALAVGTGTGTPPPGMAERPIEDLPDLSTSGEEPGRGEES